MSLIFKEEYKEVSKKILKEQKNIREYFNEYDLDILVIKCNEWIESFSENIATNLLRKYLYSDKKEEVIEVLEIFLKCNTNLQLKKKLEEKLPPKGIKDNTGVKKI